MQTLGLFSLDSTDLAVILLSSFFWRISDPSKKLSRASKCPQTSHAPSQYLVRFFSFTRRAPGRLSPHILSPSQNNFPFADATRRTNTRSSTKLILAHHTLVRRRQRPPPYPAFLSTFPSKPSSLFFSSAWV